MSGRDRGWVTYGAAVRRRARCGLVGVSLLLAAAHAGAQSAPTAPATSTGSYSVSYSSCNGCSAEWLEEKVGDSGQWTHVGQGTVSFTGKAPGTYHYRVGNFWVLADWSYSTQTSYSAQTTVTVVADATPVDPLERQLTYRYEARKGDINADGRLDLFVKRRSGGTAGNGALEAVLLLQQSSGRFSARAPTAAQQRTASGWPAASTQLLLQDVNADGFVDVVLKGVAAAVGVSAAMNQIVYSPGRVSTQAALGVRAIDSSLRQFASNAYGYLANPQYFIDNAPVVVVTTTYWESWCDPGYGYGYGDYVTPSPGCSWIPYTITTVLPDYSVFDQRAVSIWSDESAILRKAKTRAKGLDAIEATVEQVLTVPVGGWVLNGRSGEAGSLDDRDYRRGFELFVSLLGLGKADGREGNRRTDRVYVTGRRIVGWLPFMHTALEYGRATVSAYDSDSRVLGNGVLVSEKNWVGDLPHLMMTLGTASKSGTTHAGYWSQLLAADTRYRDNLPYSPTPKAGEGRFNSNGFVHGLIRATGGTTNVDMNRHPGGDVPVPGWAFN